MLPSKDTLKGVRYFSPLPLATSPTGIWAASVVRIVVSCVSFKTWRKSMSCALKLGVSALAMLRDSTSMRWLRMPRAFSCRLKALSIRFMRTPKAWVLTAGLPTRGPENLAMRYLLATCMPCSFSGLCRSLCQCFAGCSLLGIGAMRIRQRQIVAAGRFGNACRLAAGAAPTAAQVQIPQGTVF